MSLQRRTFAEMLTFTRAGTATYFDANGVMQTAAADQPRFDYDPITLACKGLLIEGGRTNLLTYSSEFVNAAWVKTNSTIVENNATAPDGTLTADKLVENTSNTPHYLYQVATTAAGSVTVAYRVKASGRDYLQIRLQEDGAFLARAEFNLSTGTAIPISGSVAKIVALKDGWYLISLTATSAGSSTFQTQLWLYNDTPVSTYTGDGTSGIYVWGAQIEAGAFPSSYIPTTTAAITRAADVCLMTGTDFSRWFNPLEGTIVVEFSTNATGVGPAGGNNFPFVYDLDNPAAPSDGYRLITSAGYGPGVRTEVFNGGVSQFSFSTPIALGTGAVIKHSLAYKTNDFASALNGGAVQTDASGVLPTPNRLTIGSQDGGSPQMLDGHIRSIRYWPNRLSNALLQEVTA